MIPGQNVIEPTTDATPLSLCAQDRVKCPVPLTAPAAPEPEPAPAPAKKPAAKKPAAAPAPMDVEDPARPAADALTAAEVEKMKVYDLKLALEARGLSTEGLKKVLKARLLAALG